MSVQEIIAQLETLGPLDRLRVKAALERLETRSAEADEAARQRAEAAWDRLLKGFGTAGGKHLSENIDEALYGGEE